MEFLKTRSKVLIISTLFSTIAGVITIFNSLYGLWYAFTPDDELMMALSIVLLVPFALIFCGMALVAGIFAIFTAWRALKTNKKSYHIGNVILNIVTFFLGIPLIVFR